MLIRLTALHRVITIVGISILCLTSCNIPESTEGKSENNEKKRPEKLEPLFTLLEPEATGIKFRNDLIENAFLNSFVYDYYYNGGGVAVGDIDNDGLVDIFFTGNTEENRLYKNLGDWKFEDITDDANVGAPNTWCTGASMVDLNADGYLDIYVCRSLKSKNKNWHKNLLYINNGDLTFTESARKYGLADEGFSTQASFFDYDRDGDLDVFVANHPVDFNPNYANIRRQKWINPPLGESNHLFRNNGNNTFSDVTANSGLLSYDFTLGVITADMNDDSWPDIYLANDYEHPDRYYINNGNGTFTENLDGHFRHTSHFSMGVDYSDINNDELSDLVVVDMVAEDNYRNKTMMPSMNIDRFWRYVSMGYHYQYMRNILQKNNGDATFSEIGQLAGIAKTDWSWAVLMPDFNLDGWNDIYITNGYYRDTRNVDYRNYFEENYSNTSMTNELLQEMFKIIPQQKINNYYFENGKNFHFINKSKESGIDHPSFSNGATYADLDNDGDLDLLVNNLGDNAFVYRNNSIENGSGNYLSFRLKGANKNLNGIGAKITVKNKGLVQKKEHIVSRGYQSGVSNLIHFGLGELRKADEVIIDWPSGRSESISDVAANQVITFNESNAGGSSRSQRQRHIVFKKQPDQLGIDYRHFEEEYDDYEKEVLLPHKMSQLGPKIAVGDVNGDDLEDVFIGGASGTPGKLYYQQANGKFKSSNNGPWVKDYGCEDIGVAFFDADNDDDLDLYVVSGSNEFEIGSSLYLDRLYLNDGKGNYSKSKGRIPRIKVSGSCVVPEDFDQDGDIDLFVGGRQIPGKYPFPANSFILENKNGLFKDVSEELIPELHNVGMVTSAVWSDFNNDSLKDLIITGEWMPIQFFENKDGKFTEVTKDLNMDSTVGWWNIIVESDLNNDGLKDYVVGNLGENYKYKASKEVPFPVYVNDFDENGTQDIVLGYSYNGDYYPVRGRECSSEQMPIIKKRFPSYDAFGKANLQDIYGEGLKTALHYKAYEFSSVVLQNTGNGFVIKPLPVDVQFSTVQGIIVNDFNRDGNEDILLAGNLFVSEIETGRADAGMGVYLVGDGNFGFDVLTNKDCGFFAPGDVRDLKLINNPNHKPHVIVANNNNKIQLFTSRK